MTRTKCPVPHEVDRNFSVVPLDCCGICGGSGYIEPEALLKAVVKMEIDGFKLDLVKTEKLGPLWLCSCSLFYRSTAMPPICEHTVAAFKRMRDMRKT